MRAQARPLTDTKASPGGRASAFWLPTTTTSTPQPAVSRGMAPAPEIASTTSSVSGLPRAMRASASTSWPAPVVDARPAHRLLRHGVQRRGSGGEEAALRDHRASTEIVENLVETPREAAVINSIFMA